MSKTGTVKSWRGPFGFAEMEDGTLVYIHKSEIDGGNLRIGRQVKFDVETVEGHNGRMKGTNVSGEGVKPKGETLNDEQAEEDAKLLKETKTNKSEERKKELDGALEAVAKLQPSTKSALVKKLAGELELVVVSKKAAEAQKAAAKKVQDQVEKLKQDLASAKQKTPKQQPETPEKRADPTDPNGKKKYTKQEFIDFYGKKNGEKVWSIAEAEKKAAQPVPSKKAPKKK